MRLRVKLWKKPRFRYDLKTYDSSRYKTSETAADPVKIDAQLFASQQSQSTVSKAKPEAKSHSRRVQSRADVRRLRWRSNNPFENDSQNWRGFYCPGLSGRRQAEQTIGGEKDEPQETAAQGAAFQRGKF